MLSAGFAGRPAAGCAGNHRCLPGAGGGTREGNDPGRKDRLRGRFPGRFPSGPSPAAGHPGNPAGGRTAGGPERHPEHPVCFRGGRGGDLESRAGQGDGHRPGTGCPRSRGSRPAGSRREHLPESALREELRVFRGGPASCRPDGRCLHRGPSRTNGPSTKSISRPSRRPSKPASVPL